eukprot:gene6794-7570_t
MDTKAHNVRNTKYRSNAKLQSVSSLKRNINCFNKDEVNTSASTDDQHKPNSVLTSATVPVESMRWCHFVFRAEGILLLLTGLPLLFTPDIVMYMQGINLQTASDPVSRGNLSQFGSMCLLMAYIGIFARIQRDIIAACLLGDILWMYAFVSMGDHINWEAIGARFSFWIVVFLAS